MAWVARAGCVRFPASLAAPDAAIGPFATHPEGPDVEPEQTLRRTIARKTCDTRPGLKIRLSERTQEAPTTLKHSDRRIALRADVRPTEQTGARPLLARSHTTRGFMIACVAIIGSVLGPNARAGIVTLNIASVAGANIEIKGSDRGAAVQFNDSASGQGFVITASTATGDSVGLNGTLGGTFSYSLGGMTAGAGGQTAPLVTNGGTLTITDASQRQLTAKIAGINVATVGSRGLINVDGDLNLTSISSSGTNADSIDFSKQGLGVGPC